MMIVRFLRTSILLVSFLQGVVGTELFSKFIRYDQDELLKTAWRAYTEGDSQWNQFRNAVLPQERQTQPLQAVEIQTDHLWYADHRVEDNNITNIKSLSTIVQMLGYLIDTDENCDGMVAKNAPEAIGNDQSLKQHLALQIRFRQSSCAERYVLLLLAAMEGVREGATEGELSSSSEFFREQKLLRFQQLQTRFEPARRWRSVGDIRLNNVIVDMEAMAKHHEQGLAHGFTYLGDTFRDEGYYKCIYTPDEAVPFPLIEELEIESAGRIRSEILSNLSPAIWEALLLENIQSFTKVMSTEGSMITASDVLGPASTTNSGGAVSSGTRVSSPVLARGIQSIIVFDMATQYTAQSVCGQILPSLCDFLLRRPELMKCRNARATLLKIAHPGEQSERFHFDISGLSPKYSSPEEQYVNSYDGVVSIHLPIILSSSESSGSGSVILEISNGEQAVYKEEHRAILFDSSYAHRVKTRKESTGGQLILELRLCHPCFDSKVYGSFNKNLVCNPDSIKNSAQIMAELSTSVVDENDDELVKVLSTKTIKVEKACSPNEPKEQDVGPECFSKIWEMVGCTATAPTYTDWHAGQTFEILVDDSRQYAASENEVHSMACYGQPTKPTTAEINYKANIAKLKLYQANMAAAGMGNVGTATSLGEGSVQSEMQSVDGGNPHIVGNNGGNNNNNNYGIVPDTTSSKGTKSASEKERVKRLLNSVTQRAPIHIEDDRKDKQREFPEDRYYKEAQKSIQDSQIRAAQQDFHGSSNSRRALVAHGGNKGRQLHMQQIQTQISGGGLSGIQAQLQAAAGRGLLNSGGGGMGIGILGRTPGVMNAGVTDIMKASKSNVYVFQPDKDNNFGLPTTQALVWATSIPELENCDMGLDDQHCTVMLDLAGERFGNSIQTPYDNERYGENQVQYVDMDSYDQYVVNANGAFQAWRYAMNCLRIIFHFQGGSPPNIVWQIQEKMDEFHQYPNEEAFRMTIGAARNLLEQMRVGVGLHSMGQILAENFKNLTRHPGVLGVDIIRDRNSGRVFTMNEKSSKVNSSTSNSSSGINGIKSIDKTDLGDVEEDDDENDAYVTHSPTSLISIEENNPGSVPIVGLGTRELFGQSAYDSVLYALKSGIRHIDVSEGFGNANAVGQAITDAMAKEGIRREEIFVTSKCSVSCGYLGLGQGLSSQQVGGQHNQGYGAQSAIISPQDFERSFSYHLQMLKLDYVDAYLLPIPKIRSVESLQLIWNYLEQLVDYGKVRYIGLQNTGVREIEYIQSFARIRPKIVENIFNIYKQGQHDLAQAATDTTTDTTHRLEEDGRNNLIVDGGSNPTTQTSMTPTTQTSIIGSVKDWCLKSDIEFIGMSTLSRFPYVLNPVADPFVVKFAHYRMKTVQQILLRWALQHGIRILFRTGRQDRIAENLEIFNFKLSEREMHVLDTIQTLPETTSTEVRPGWVPDLFSLDKSSAKEDPELVEKLGGICPGVPIASSNIGVECWKKLWVAVGCLESTAPEYNEWHRGNSLKFLHEDAKQWAIMRDKTHRQACYGKNADYDDYVGV